MAMTPHDMFGMADLLAAADRVIAMEDLRAGDTDPRAIVMRHDVDHADGALDNALAMAQWEKRAGYRSTYFFLHTASYWKPENAWMFKQIASLGHEIGFHNNAVAHWLKYAQRAPRDIIRDECHRLRVWSGANVLGTTAHGDQELSALGHRNWQIFTESPGQIDCNPLLDLGLHTFPLVEAGLDYQGEFLPRTYNLVDSGGSWDAYYDGEWRMTLQQARQRWPYKSQMTVLLHPDHWPAALFEAVGP